MRYFSWLKWASKLKLLLRQIIQNGAIFYVLALLVLLPVWFEPTMALKSTVQDTLFVIDISESMNVRDVNYPRPKTDRLTLAKLAVSASMASLPCGSRVSVALFAGDESVVLFEPLEICRHYAAIEQMVSMLNRQMRWVGDSKLTYALKTAILEAEERQMNLVVLTDGDEMPHRATPRIDELLTLRGKVKGVLLGVGGIVQQPIPHLDAQNQITGYWTAEEAVLQGNYPNLLADVKALSPGERARDGLLDEVTEHLSAYNTQTMQAVSGATQLALERINNASDAVRTLNQIEYQKEAIAERDARWIFGLVSVFLIILGWFWPQIYPRLFVTRL